MTDMTRPGLKFHLDLDTGDVYQQDDNGLWVLEGTIPGTGGGFPGDGLAPPKVVGLTIEQATAQQPDGTTVPALVAIWTASTALDVIGYDVEWDDDPLFGSPQARSVGGTFAGIEPVIGGVTYNVRVRAYDIDVLKGPWSDVVQGTVAGDAEAPAAPDDIAVLPGYRLLGVRWARGPEQDLDHYDVRWTPDLAGVPDVDNWVVIITHSSSVVIDDLGLVATYWVQVRAVDRSDNVVTSLADPTPVPSRNEPEAGWSTAVSGTTLAVGSEDMAVHELAAEFINTGVLNADRVVTGRLEVGAPGMAEGIEVFDQFGRSQGTWDERGMLMVNPDTPSLAMWLKSGFLRFTTEYTGNPDTTVWQTAITPWGINVEAITFGAATGGSNLIPNAGCELTVFATAVDVTKEWTLAADWATGTGRINLNVSTGDLTLAAI